MKVLVALFLIMLCNLLAPGFQGADWIRLDSTLGDFSILMPCEAKEKKETADSQFGPYTSYMFSCTSTEREIYIVGWVDYEPKFVFNPQKENPYFTQVGISKNAKLFSIRPNLSVILRYRYRIISFNLQVDQLLKI